MTEQAFSALPPSRTLSPRHRYARGTAFKDVASIVRRFRAGEIASEYYDRDKGWYLTPGTVARFFRDCSTKFENVVNSLE